MKTDPFNAIRQMVRDGSLPVALLLASLPVLPAAFFILRYMLPNLAAQGIRWELPDYQVLLGNLFQFLLLIVTLGVFGLLGSLKPGDRGFTLLGLVLVVLLMRSLPLNQKGAEVLWVLFFLVDLFASAVFIVVLLSLVRLLPNRWNVAVFVLLAVLTLTPVVGMSYGSVASSLYEAFFSALNFEHFIGSMLHTPWVGLPLLLLTGASSFLVARKCLGERGELVAECS